MKTLIRVAAVAAALFMASTTTGAAQAVNACYVPAVGAIYLVGLPGLPAGCLAAAHTAIALGGGGGGALADGSITAVKLADGAVITIKLADGSVTAAKLATNAVGANHIATNAVGSDEVASSAIGSSEIADGAVTGLDLASGAVTAPKIANAAIGTAHLADASVTAAKLAPGAVSLEHTTVFTPLTSVPASGSEFPFSVDCPSGFLPVAGVFNKDSYVLQITFSRPTATGWSFRVHNVGSTTRALFMGVYCIKLR